MIWAGQDLLAISGFVNSIVMIEGNYYFIFIIFQIIKYIFNIIKYKNNFIHYNLIINILYIIYMLYNIIDIL